MGCLLGGSLEDRDSFLWISKLNTMVHKNIQLILSARSVTCVSFSSKAYFRPSIFDNCTFCQHT